MRHLDAPSLSFKKKDLRARHVGDGHVELKTRAMP